MANIAKIMELYTAYFNRAADKDGVDYWANEMDTKAWTLDDVANSFAQQTEYTALYAGKTNAEIVELVYTNVLNRAADTDGATYWEGQLTNGAVTVSQLIQAVVNAATEKDGSGNYKNATDAAIVNNKTAVSQYAYDSNVNAKNISLAGVTADVASIDAAKASVDAANPANVGETFTLTTSIDDLTGTAKSDMFTAKASTLIAEGTLQVKDKMDGGAGVNTLKVAVDTDFAGFDTSGGTTNIQKVILDAATVVNFNASGIKGATEYTLNSAKNINISNIDTLGTVNINGAKSTTTSIAYKASAVAGETDAATIGLSNVGTAKTDTVAKVATAITMAGVENVTLNTSGTNVVDLVGITEATNKVNLKVTGSGNNEITAVSANVKGFDASTSTGTNNVNLKAATIATTGTIKGGTGQDTVTLGVDADTTTQYTMSGVETLELNNTSNTLTFAGTNVTGLTTINNNVTNAGATKLVDMGAIALTINSTGATADAADIDTDNTGTVTLNLNAAAAAIKAKTAEAASAADYTFATTDAVTVNVGEYAVVGSAGAGSIITANKASDLTINVASGKDATGKIEQTTLAGAFSAAKAKTITLNAEGNVTAAKITAAEAITANITTGTTASSLVLDTVTLKTLNLTANENLLLTTGATTNFNTIQSANITLNNAILGKTTTTALETMTGLNILNVTGTVNNKTTALDESSAIILGDLGKATNNYDLTVTASGLDGTAGTITTAAATAGVAGFFAGNVVTGTAKNINLNLAAVEGAIAVGNVGNTTVKDVAITATSSKGAVKVGNVDASGDTNITIAAKGAVAVGTINAAAGIKTGSDVTLNLSGTKGAVEFGVIKGDNVSVDVSGIEGVVTIPVSAITAHSSVTIKSQNTTSSTWDIVQADTNDATVVTGKAFVVDYTGGIGTDIVNVTGLATTTSITVKGNMNTAGADTDVINVNNSNSTEVTSAINISALSYAKSAITTSATSAETITLGAGKDTITVTAADTKIDTLVNFKAGAAGDLLKTGIAGANYFDLTGEDLSTSLTVEAAYAAAAALYVDSTKAYKGAAAAIGDIFAFDYKGKAYLAQSGDTNATYDAADYMVEITGTVTADLVAANVIA